MEHNLPSIKTLNTIAPERGKELRAVLEITSFDKLEDLAKDKYPATARYIRSCFNSPSFQHLKLTIADEILGTHGVECIQAGRNKKSPAIDYCNSGDTYSATLMYVSGKGYRVGCWGDIVERGSYE